MMQKERLRHLMSSAILELWKKETGSRTSVSIDATICITPRNGRTTIIQVEVINYNERTTIICVQVEVIDYIGLTTIIQVEIINCIGHV